MYSTYLGTYIMYVRRGFFLFYRLRTYSTITDMTDLHDLLPPLRMSWRSDAATIILLILTSIKLAWSGGAEFCDIHGS